MRSVSVRTVPTTRDDVPLVGRLGELAQLEVAVAGAAAGVGTACAVIGPAGIGKSRLAGAAVGLARRAGFRCVWVAGWPDGGSPPLWPWQHVLTQLGAAEPASPPGSGESDRFDAFRRVAEAVQRAAVDQPVLIVVDDAHLADAGALLLARFVVRALRSHPALLLVTIRDDVELADDVRSAIDDLVREATVVRPSPLGVDDIAALIDAAGWDSSTAAAEQMLAATHGNPLFVRELLALGATGATLTTDSVRSVLQHRIDALPGSAARVLAVLALLGPLADWSMLADVAQVDEPVVRRAVDQARAAGIVSNTPGAIGTFSHGLFADVLLTSFERDELAGLHLRAAQRLSTADHTQHRVAAARHALRAATLRRDPATVSAATDASTVAAATLTAGCAYEAAAQLLTDVVDLLDQLRRPVPTAVVLQLAQAHLSAGDLRNARTWFRRAADQAEAPVELATAALGLGGIWVHEHRAAVDHASFMGLLARAIDGLGDDRADLAVRLTVRLEAEHIYVGTGTFAGVEAAVQAARDTGDALVLAEALSLWHHTMLGPAFTGPARLAIANELVRVAATAGDEVLTLMGGLWRTVDLYLMGDALAERALAESRERADALQVGAVLFVLEAIDVMRMIRNGEIDAAEAAANRCFERGISIGDADAVGYLGGQLLTIRWLQLRPEDIVDVARQVATSPSLVEGDVAPRAAAAVLAAMLHDHDQARADLHHAMTRMQRGVETSSNWMITMFCVVEAAALLGDRKTAESVYDSMLPFRHLPIIGSLGVVCLGSAERTLGVAASTLGDHELAVHHFERAVDQNHRLGHRVMAAISEGDLGCARIARGAPGDVVAGRRHVEQAAAALDGFGLHRRTTALRAATDDLLAGSPLPDGSIVRTMHGWSIAFGDHHIDLPDSVGVERLVALLERPGQDVVAGELLGAGRSSRHEINDLSALQAYRSRVDELRAEIDEADSDHDLERAALRRDELDQLLETIAPSLGLRGRTRAFVDAGERARVTVRKSIGRVLDAVARADPVAGELIQASIHTGSACRFDPVHGVPPVWRFTDRR